MVVLGSYQVILQKLSVFTKKYYTKQLVKGVLLFLTLGLLFWFVVLSLEFMLWLNQSWRLALFLIFVLVELYLLYRFIITPLLLLFRLRGGLSNRDASLIIGKHFPEVDDKLLNLLQLSENPYKSDLILASIEQRANAMRPVPFTDAVNFRESLKYAKYVAIPVVLFGFIWLTGNVVSFFNSHKRVVNYAMEYERPAPFQFRLLNERLEVLDNEPLEIQVGIEGDSRPENVFLVIDGKELLMRENGGVYHHTFEAPVNEASFYLTANGWDSQRYFIQSFRTPALTDFQMSLDFPDYLDREGKVITGTGNAIVPEGTKITWNIIGSFIDSIEMVSMYTLFVFDKNKDAFSFSNTLYEDLAYELRTSNEHVKDFEKLAYAVEVVKDQKATVQVEQVLDSLLPNESFYTGQAADDHGIDAIRLVCYPTDDTDDVQRVLLESPNSNVHQFYYTFPSGLLLETGKNYKLYFEVVDNDGIRGGKISKSQVFNATLYDDNQLKNKELDYQNATLSNFNKSLDKYKQQEETLSKLNQSQKEEKSLSFEDKGQIKDFLQKQQQQEELMKKFSKDLSESIDKNQADSELKKMLQERLERQEKEAQKNAKLLEELNKLADKINKEELQQRLEELGKNQGKNSRNLEQILELTKRYYVTEKASQIGRELDKLSKKQEILSDLKLGEDFSNSEQEKLNEAFKDIEKDLRELEKDNQKLQKPIELNADQKKTDAIKQDQEDALEEINKHQGMDQSSQGKEKQQAGDNASKKQKSAAQKMKELSEGLQQGAAGGGSSDTEDAEMLRQILDNLVTFSFKQENLFDNLQSADVDISQFSKTVRDQQNLRRLFEHVDDSLFALSLRRAELSEFVNEQITEVYYNIDKSLESISENQIYQGASYQQYVINATNALADFLANVLDNMQQNMSSGQGSGQGSDFQLPDIIQGQQSIQEKMNGEGKEGDQPNQQGDKQGGQEEGGQQSPDGEQGKEGNQDKGKGNKEGDSNGESGNGQDEMGLSEIYEIYKEQQFLRQKLEEQLEDLMNKEDQNLTKKLLQQMEDFENDLLENGITERTKNKANNIQHQLMKLENATLEQGEKEERESTRNQKDYTNPIITRPELLEDYQNEIEILNRQALPLRQNYERKVKVYFNNDRVPF